MAGPAKQFDKDEALGRALHLFWTQGYEATSMQDLVDAMGINRASMYQTYGNKHQLFLASIQRYMDGSLANLQQLQQAPGSALTNLRGFFEDVVCTDNQRQGCLINNTAVELGPHDAELAARIRAVWGKFEDVFAAMLHRAIDDGEIKADSDERQLAQLLNVNLQGLLVKSKANTPQDDLLDCVRALFDLIKK